MSARARKRSFRVSYWIEQGFRADIEARSPAEAESIIEQMLESGDAIDAKCVHGDWHVVDIEEDTP